MPLGEDGQERTQILRHGAFADEHGHALGELLQRFFLCGQFMLGAHAGREIGIERAPAQQRRVTVDMPSLEGRELGEHARVLRQHAGKIHELGEADDLRMSGERQEIADLEPRAGGFELGRWHAARKLDAYVHDGLGRGRERVAQPVETEHIRYLMGVPDRGRDAMWQHATIELGGREKRGFDVAMRVDEARHHDLAGGIDLALAAIAVFHADDAIPANRNVAKLQRSGDEIEDAPTFDGEIGGCLPETLIDGAGQEGLVMQGLVMHGRTHAP